MIGSTALLEGLAVWLASEGLAQYRADGSYTDNPALPSVVFSPVDAPDTIVLLEVKADQRFSVGAGAAGAPTGSGGGLAGPPPRVDVNFTYRAVGVDSLAVEGIASAVVSRIAVLAASGARDRLGIRVQPVLFVVAGVDVRADAIRLMERGLPELVSQSKYAGARYTRTDVYRVSVF